jgi:hypothetical protein
MHFSLSAIISDLYTLPLFQLHYVIFTVLINFLYKSLVGHNL